MKEEHKIDAERMKNENILISVRNLKKYFPVYGGFFGRKTGEVKAVDGVSFDIKQGETLGLVGESGCGKSTTGRTVINLYDATSGEIFYRDVEKEKITEIVSGGNRNENIIRRHMQIIFQDPYASLNPRMKVGSIIEEPLIIHGIGDNSSERKDMVADLLRKVGMEPDSGNRYPHEFSGGQRQRIGIARALSVKPRFIVADEPVSALDVSVQSQVLNLLQELQDEFGLTYLFIAHDLSVVEHISNTVAVMYLGEIVETASSMELYRNPLHPYTKALLSAIPVPDPDQKNKKRIVLTGDIPSPEDKPSGCSFRTRCPFAVEICSMKTPQLREFGTGHVVACHRVEELFNQRVQL